MFRIKYLSIIIAVLFLSAGTIFAEPVTVEVRVKAGGAKFIGTSMGGVLITITDVHTGERFAEGITEGGTGDTEKIMNTPRTGETVLSDETSAKFTADMELDRPRYVEIKAYGPLAQPQAANTVTITQWLIPGIDLTEGDAVMLEMPGFVVDILDPPAHVKIKEIPHTFTIRANVTLMCGCPIAPDVPWKPEDYRMMLRVEKGEKALAHLPLTYAGTHSQFEGTFTAEQPGVYKAIVYAVDASRGSTGLDMTTFILEEEEEEEEEEASGNVRDSNPD